MSAPTGFWRDFFVTPAPDNPPVGVVREYADRATGLFKIIGPSGAPALTSSSIANPTPDWFNVKNYGAKGDARIVQDGSATLNSPIIHSATIAFTQADVGKSIFIAEFGTVTVANSPGSPAPTIISVQSATQATLSVNANQTNTGTLTFVLGTDDTAAFAAAFSALFALLGGVLFIPCGNYLMLGNWGTLGSDNTNIYTVTGSGDLNSDAASLINAAGQTTIITSPYNTYTSRFLTREWSGTLENIAFTDLGITNINHASFSNLILFYNVDIGTYFRNLSFNFTLQAGSGNVVMSDTCDHSVYENVTVIGGGCGGLRLEGGGYYANLSATGGDFGVDFPVQGISTFVGGSFRGSSGPGAHINGSVLSSFPLTFLGTSFFGSGTGANSAIVTENGGSRYNVFDGCNFNYPSLSQPSSGNFTAINNALGNTLVINGGLIAGYGSGFGIQNAGRVVIANVMFPTAMPWSANTVVWASGTQPTYCQDAAGHLQKVTTGGTTGAGPTPPSFSDSGGTVNDNGVIWTDQGVAATLFDNTGVGTLIDGGGNLFGINPSTSGSGFFGTSSITGTVAVATSIAPSAGWGTTGAAGNGVSAVSGNTRLIQFTITATGTPGASPTITITFPTKFFQAPICRLVQVDGTNFTDVTLPVVTSGPSVSSVTFTLTGTPVSGHTYTFQAISDLA